MPQLRKAILGEQIDQLARRYLQAGEHWIHMRTSKELAHSEAEDIVLVHGVGATSRYLVPTAGMLARNFTVYAPDLPGFGRSSKPRRALTLPELADALAAWMDAVNLKQAAFLGNSFGCQVLVEFALRYPDRVSRLVLQGPTVDAEARTWPQQASRWLLNGQLEPAALGLILIRDYMDCGLRRLFATFQHSMEDPLEEKLPQVEHPALVVRGSRDPIVPHRWAQTVTDLLPHGRFVEVPGAAHTLVYAQPLELTRVTRPFFNEANAAPSTLSE